MLIGNILITGGAGCWGREIIRRAHDEHWDCRLTIFSTDAMKHAQIRMEYPETICMVGDVRDPNVLYNAMAGKDGVIHLAAVKHIPVSEVHSLDTIENNIIGSLNVCATAAALGVPTVIGVSTDKAAHPANCYGATKLLMEKIFQEYSRIPSKTKFYLLRAGNVLASTGSVIEIWKKAVERGEPIQVTNPAMTRFWMSPYRAIECIWDALVNIDTGSIYIPKLSALSIGKLAEYTIQEERERPWPTEEIPMRAGEKLHETLLSVEEGAFAQEHQDHYELFPTITKRKEPALPAYTSDTAPELSKADLEAMLRNG